MEKVYLDNNASTPVRPEVIEAMLPFFGSKFGNASSIHGFGREAKKYLEKSRIQVAKLINAASADEIIFTSGGTESDNHAIKGVASSLCAIGTHIITSSVEHPAVRNSCKYLEDIGFQVTYLNVDEYGLIDLEELKNAIREDTILVSIMAANNETGTIMPFQEIGRITTERGVLFHSDAVQMVGKMPFDVQASGADFVSISAHKFNGPKGVGALYVKKGKDIAAFMHGGEHEKKRRSGTENIPAVIGFGKTCELAKKEENERPGRLGDLRDMLHKRIVEEFGPVKLNGHPEKRVTNTLNVSFEGLDGETIVQNLDLDGIAVSTGAACTSGSLEPSHVLKSMGLSKELLQGSVRFSMGIFNSQEDIEYVMEKLPNIKKRLRSSISAEKTL